MSNVSALTNDGKLFHNCGQRCKSPKVDHNMGDTIEFLWLTREDGFSS